MSRLAVTAVRVGIALLGVTGSSRVALVINKRKLAERAT